MVVYPWRHCSRLYEEITLLSSTVDDAHSRHEWIQVLFEVLKFLYPGKFRTSPLYLEYPSLATLDRACSAVCPHNNLICAIVTTREEEPREREAMQPVNALCAILRSLPPLGLLARPTGTGRHLSTMRWSGEQGASSCMIRGGIQYMGREPISGTTIRNLADKGVRMAVLLSR